MFKALALTLLLACGVQAAPPVKKLPFTAKFRRPTTVVRETEGNAYGWEGDHEGEFLYVITDQRYKTLDALKGFMRKSLGAHALISEEKKITVAGKPALEWRGLDANGVPFTLRLVRLPGGTFAYAGVGMNQVQNQAFVDSVRFR